MSPTENTSVRVAVLEFYVCHSQGNLSPSAIHTHPTLDVV
jgi:hypothetical protein